MAFAALVGILLGAGLYLRNFLLRQVEKQIRSIIQYSSLRLRILPPSVILENVRTVSPPGLFSAEEVQVRLPLESLFKREKPLVIVVTRPVIRISPGPPAGEKRKRAEACRFSLSLSRGPW